MTGLISMVYSRVYFSFRKLLSNTQAVLRSTTVLGSRRITFAAFRTIVTAAQEQHSIQVNWDKEKDTWSKFHYEWLRDNCPCTKCRHPDFDQRLLSSLEDATPSNIDVKGSDVVEIEWKDGHRSRYSYKWLLDNSYCHHNLNKPETEKRREVILWDRDTMVNPPVVNYDDVMANDKGLLELLRNIYCFGVCFVPDTPVAPEAMMELATKIGPIRQTYYGTQWFMEAGNMSVNHVSYTKEKILSHTDNPYLQHPPGLFCLHAVEYVSGEGGETTLTDGFKIASYIKQHNPEYFSLLSNVSVLYKIAFKDKLLKDEAIYKSRQYTFTVDDDGEMMGVNINHVDRRPLDEISLSQAKKTLSCGADEAMKKMYSALHLLHQLVYSGQFTYKVGLQPGNMVLMNNWRVSHGRNILSTGFRRISGIYLNRDEWMSKLMVLEQHND